MRRGQIGRGIMSAAVLLAVAFAVPQASWAATILDTMDRGWTFNTEGGTTTRSAGYSDEQFTSAPTSIRLYVANGGMDGTDWGTATGDKDFSYATQLRRLKIRYYIAQQTDTAPHGGMAGRAAVRITTHHAGGGQTTYEYIVACSETNTGDPWADDYCELRPNTIYVDENNQKIDPPGDAELEPTTGEWHTLDRYVNDDFTIDWCTVTHVTIQVMVTGGYMYLDVFEVYFDDLELTFLDTMDNCWTFNTEGGTTTRSAGYSDEQFTSAPTSIRLYVANGGMGGADWGTATGDKDFTLRKLSRLKIRYYIAQQTDTAPHGGMAGRAAVRMTTHHAGGGQTTYEYIVACSETNTGDPWADDYCELRPNTIYVDENNQKIDPPGDAELEPTTGEWHTLDRYVNDDFTIDWSAVTHVTIQVMVTGGYMYLDVFEVYFDDLDLTTWAVAVPAMSYWGLIICVLLLTGAGMWIMRRSRTASESFA